MPFVAMSLGSNLGDRESNIDSMERQLRCILDDARSSPLMETEPVGVIGPQPPYLNRILTGYYEGYPTLLLAACLYVEGVCGRVRETPKGPRTADVDILLFGDQEVNETVMAWTLVIPHPELLNRRFCLEGLARIDPQIVVPGPGGGRTVGELFENMPAGVAAQNVFFV